MQKQPGCSQNSRFLPHFRSQISAAENCFQEDQALPSVRGWRALLAKQDRSSPLKQRAAGGEGYSLFNPATSDGQSSPLCSTAYKSLEEHPPAAVVYLGTSDMSFDLLCATVTQQANQLGAGSSLEARCCVQSKISQGAKSKAQSDKLHDTAQAQLSSARDSNYCFAQLLCMDIRKTGRKIPLLNIRMVYPQHPQRVTCGRSTCQDLLSGPAAASGILSAAICLQMG